MSLSRLPGESPAVVTKPRADRDQSYSGGDDFLWLVPSAYCASENSTDDSETAQEISKILDRSQEMVAHQRVPGDTNAFNKEGNSSFDVILEDIFEEGSSDKSLVGLQSYQNLPDASSLTEMLTQHKAENEPQSQERDLGPANTPLKRLSDPSEDEDDEDPESKLPVLPGARPCVTTSALVKCWLRGVFSNDNIFANWDSSHIQWDQCPGST